jgi:hypothetical protein
MKSVEALSFDHSPVVLLMELERHKTTLPRIDPFTVNWAYCRHLLRQVLPGNPIITSPEELDIAVVIFTPMIKSEKTPQNSIVH